MPITGSSIFSEVKHYLKFGRELQAHLTRHPNDWYKFQDRFNLTLDKVYNDILQFEKENAYNESKVYKMKKIFEQRYRHYFLFGEYIKWSYEKPFGYAGDFKIIDDIYQNHPCTTGFTRLWDNWFLQLAAPNAVRQRKEDFKKIILDFVKKHRNRDIRIMNLACGSAREIKELQEDDPDKLFSKVTFDCYDNETRAIEYSRQLLNNPDNVNFFQKNAIRLALKKDIKDEITLEYDLIYSTGLFDYLDERVATRLIANLKKLIKQSGLLVIANFGDKYSNYSAAWMEWVVNWYLIHRTEDEFERIFLDAGILRNDLQVMPQQNKMMYYCFVKSN